MTPTTPKNTYLFDCIFVSLAIFSPILMVIVASMLPEGSRGGMIVTGHTFLVSILVLALVFRVVYGIGFVQCVQATSQMAASLRDRARRVGLRSSRQL
ncbi:MAG: hypothetical protein ABSC32_15290 [Steroidobacteraceae bacterium]|jgi:hypothetical protein